MDRLILPYERSESTPQRSIVPRAHFQTAPSHAITYQSAGGAEQPTAQPKTARDYLRGIRRRFWLAILVATLVLTGGTIYVLRQPSIYRAEAIIQITQPNFNTVLAQLLTDDVVHFDNIPSTQFESNLLSQLRTREMLTQALLKPRIGEPVTSEEEIQQLLDDLQTRRLPNSTHYEIMLEGDDPSRVAAILNSWLSVFADDAQRSVDDKILNSQNSAQEHFNKLNDQLNDLQTQIETVLASDSKLLPNGENLRHHELQSHRLLQTHKMNQIEDMQRQFFLARMFPASNQLANSHAVAREIDQMQEQRDLIQQRKARLMRSSPKATTDPAMKRLLEWERELDRQMGEAEARLRDVPATSVVSEEALQHYQRELGSQIDQMKEEESKIIKDIQDRSPSYDRFIALIDQRTRVRDKMDELKTSMSSFEIIVSNNVKPVEVKPATIPQQPVRPNRLVNMVVVFVLAFGSGLAMVLVLEHLDHSVRVPEQLAAGVPLPLLGVVPRIRRTARLQRGGHLWTSGDPYSPEADAYRGLRAGIVGVSDQQGRQPTTLLITSAKTGEGKSTTALNLAATCARSGERTLLMDVDLRRSSLRPVFENPVVDPDLGLVDVLRGELPWQRVVIQSDVPHLDFLPAGDPAGVPIEILGALELKQLLTGLIGHYDRVILDGPAILGLADARMLGRIVDAAVLVVRAGSNELSPVARAKAMFEQSMIPLVGVVFNGLAEDVSNWSSHHAEELFSESQLQLQGPRAATHVEEEAAVAVGRQESWD